MFCKSEGAFPERTLLATETSGAAIFLALYTAVLAISAIHFPLWVDEILQLLDTRDSSVHQLLAWIGLNPGAVPGGYLTQFFTIRALGYSLLSARIPSICFGILGCINVFVLARKFRLKNPLVAMVIFAIFPLQFRYCIEARPYSEALCLSSLETIFFIKLLRSNDAWSAFKYTAIVTAGIYTQPFSIFTPIGHLLWFFIPLQKDRLRLSRRPASIVVGSIAMAGVLLLPWYLAAGRHWKAANIQAGYRTPISFRLLAQIFHDLVGGGYICSGAVIVLSVAGLIYALGPERHERMLLVISILTGIAGPILADAAEHYFFASRQLIFVLPALAVLVTFGLEKVRLHRRNAAVVFGLLLAGGCLLADVRYLAHPPENWQAAASRILLRTDTGACLSVIRADTEHSPFNTTGVSDIFLNNFDQSNGIEPFPRYSSAAFYTFFKPVLRTRACTAGSEGKGVISAASAHTAARVQAKAEEWLRSRGFQKSATEEVGGSRIITWNRQ